MRLVKRFKYRKVLLEDSFIRSVGIGSTDLPLGIVLDRKGIYYDASQESEFEELAQHSLSQEEAARANSLMSTWRALKLSKYNHSPEPPPIPLQTYALVIDQTFGDASIRYGMADKSSFQIMLNKAIIENPNTPIIVKAHPDVVAGCKKGHFDLKKLESQPQVRVLGDDIHPTDLLSRAKTVYTVTSQVGFEALIWGKPVRCFGMPFYAGWGLTQDELPAPERRKPITLQQLVHAALVRYPRYIDPETEQLCEVETVMAHIGLQRKFRSRFPETVYALKFSRWKKPIVERFLWGSDVSFVKNTSSIPECGTLFVWGTKPLKGELANDVSIVRLEDGFLRSVGLGADLVTPVSWVADTRGIYYDSRSESDLEHYLVNHEFDSELVTRAKNLRQRIVELGMTKYNVGSEEWKRPFAERVILVPGQVEDDASIRFGAPGICRNIELLKAVREANPDAFIVYKPHPDVMAGLRRKDSTEGLAEDFCDELVTEVAMHSLLDSVDEVHLMTSLTGFEALLRGLKVTCYGQPFYSGWGLTNDIIPIERRTRVLTIDQLVAATLILYPTYISQVTGRYTTPERALLELEEWRDKRGISQAGPWLKFKRVILGIGAKIRHARV